MPERFTGTKQILAMMAQDKMRRRAVQEQQQWTMQTPEYQQSLMQLKELQKLQQRNQIVEREFLANPDMSEEWASKLKAYAEGGPMKMYEEIVRRSKAKSLVAQKKAGTVDEALGLVDSAAQRAAVAAAEETKLRTAAGITKEFQPTAEEVAERAGAVAEAEAMGKLPAEIALERERAKGRKGAIATEYWWRQKLEETKGVPVPTTSEEDEVLKRQRERLWNEYVTGRPMKESGDAPTGAELEKARVEYMAKGALPPGWTATPSLTEATAKTLFESTKKQMDEVMDKLPESLQREGWFGSNEPEEAVNALIAKPESELKKIEMMKGVPGTLIDKIRRLKQATGVVERTGDREYVKKIMVKFEKEGKKISVEDAYKILDQLRQAGTIK